MQLFGESKQGHFTDAMKPFDISEWATANGGTDTS